MSKFVYEVEEFVKYRREMVVETSLDEDSFLYMTEKAERKAQFGSEDVASILDAHPQINVIEMPDNDMSSPMEVDVEYLDHRSGDNE